MSTGKLKKAESKITTAKGIYKIALSLIFLICLLALLFIFLKNLWTTPTWGDGLISKKEAYQCLLSSSEIIKSELNDERILTFHETQTIAQEFPDTYLDHEGAKVINVYGVKGAYQWEDEDVYHKFIYIFYARDLTKIAESSTGIYFEDIDSGTKYVNPLIQRIK
ncbi:MAG: hypothetical protein Q4P08_05260 [Eubacteriales bacterium]|nr:hypothetical protein [Eubacteriales bacterium]